MSCITCIYRAALLEHTKAGLLLTFVNQRANNKNGGKAGISPLASDHLAAEPVPIASSSLYKIAHSDAAN
jgi:hypothetical protein